MSEQLCRDGPCRMVHVECLDVSRLFRHLDDQYSGSYYTQENFDPIVTATLIWGLGQCQAFAL